MAFLCEPVLLNDNCRDFVVGDDDDVIHLTESDSWQFYGPNFKMPIHSLQYAHTNKTSLKI